MHMLAALDLATGKIHYRIRRRKRHAEFLDLLKTLRVRWSDQRLYLIMDNFSPHRHPDVREWAADNDAEPVFLPTCSSRLNWIESEFAALRYFTPQPHRPPHSSRTERRHRLVHPHLDPLPGQGCVTSHWVRAAGATGQAVRACAPVRRCGASRVAGSAPVR
jgi:hypothetical protein